MTKSWEPKIRFEDAGFKRNYLDDLMERVLSPAIISVVVAYHIERATDADSPCIAEVYEDICGKRPRYVVVTTVVNGMKESTRRNRTSACSIRHMNRRVREYFGLQRAKDYETELDEEERQERAKIRRISSL